MKIQPFEMERWQSVWENHVELNVSESGVEPLSVIELEDDPEALHLVLSTPLCYPPTNGSEETRAGIARLYPGATAANVLMTCGGSEANYVTTWAVVEPGDEVLFMQPNYMQVIGVARSFGATVKPLWLHEELQWAPDLDDLRRQVTSKTKLIVICNPNNPSGAVLAESAMDEICAAAGRVGAYILADEIYRGAERNGSTTPTFWGRYDRVFCTHGFSKAYGMPGLRVGWVVAPEEWADRLWGYHDYTSIGPTMLSDRLAALALEPQRHTRILERTRRIIRENYTVVDEWVKSHAGRLRHVPPAAGAIAWIGYGSGTDGRSSSHLAETLRQKGVLIVPGSQFEMEGYMRIGFGYAVEKLRRALPRIDAALAQATAAR
jgi:hypothetical protein